MREIRCKMSASITLAAGHSSEMGLGIGMTNGVFLIEGRRQDLKESL